MASEIETKQRRVIGRGRYLEVVDEEGWEYVRRHSTSGVVVIVATTDDGQLVLVEQPRIPVHRRTIELPAGLAGDGPDNGDESMEQAATRELEEETGFQAAHWRRMFEVPSAVGMSTELATFYRATGLTRVGAGGGDATEQITVHVVNVADMASFLSEKEASGLLIDSKVYAGLYLLSAEKQARVTSTSVPGGRQAIAEVDRSVMVPPAALAATPSPRVPFNLTLDQPQGPLPFVPRLDSDGGVSWEYEVSPDHFNPYAVLHGGVVMALLDSAMGHAVADRVHAGGRFNAAAQMNVNFLAAVRTGKLRARARVVKVGKRLAVAEAWAESSDGTVVATASSTHTLLP